MRVARSARSEPFQILRKGKTGLALQSIPAQLFTRPQRLQILRADGLVQLDFTLTKQLKFTESKALQVRAEFFNITNTTTFTAPTTTIDTASGGQIGSTLNA